MKPFVPIMSAILFCAAPLSASYDEALKLFEKKEYEHSLRLIASELITADDMKPNSPNFNLRFLAAHNHWRMGNMKSAQDHFARCIQIRKNDAAPYIDLALLQIEMKKYAEAEQTARRGLEQVKSPLLFYVAGLAAMKRGNYWRAKEMFEKANALDPELYYSYNALGIALMCLKKYGEANTAFSAALAIKPRSAAILNNLGLSYEKLGKRKEALDSYRRALAIDERNQTVKAHFSRLEGKQPETR